MSSGVASANSLAEWRKDLERQLRQLRGRRREVQAKAAPAAASFKATSKLRETEAEVAAKCAAAEGRLREGCGRAAAVLRALCDASDLVATAWAAAAPAVAEHGVSRRPTEEGEEEAAAAPAAAEGDESEEA